MTLEPSRRHFLRGAAVGAAVVGVAAVSPQAVASEDPSARPPAGDVAPKGPVTAYVRDHRTGEVAVMVGEHQVIHHDRALANKLANLASTAK